MTPPDRELSYRRYRAPQEDGGVLVLPPLAEAGPAGRRESAAAGPVAIMTSKAGRWRS